MSIMLITPKTENVLRMYTGTPDCTISGLKSFCSGSLLSGITAPNLGRTPFYAWDRPDLVAMPYKEFKTIAKWLEYYKGHIYGLPKLYMYWYIMEVVLIKATEGIGGLQEGDYRCYAGNRYATKTWFLADKKFDRKTGICTQGFIEFVKDLGTHKAGKIVISPWAEGAHGGHCRGAVWKPNLRRMKEQRDRMLYNMHAHAQYCANELGVADTPLPTDKVCNHW